MKKGLIFFFGLITGCILTVAALFYIGKVYSAGGDSGLTLFEQPVGTINSYSFEVLQVLPNGNALANSENPDWRESYTGPVVLLLADENSHYYDEQIVKVSKGKRARQVGSYQYQTNGGMHKTVPVVRIMEK